MGLELLLLRKGNGKGMELESWGEEKGIENSISFLWLL